MAQTVFYPELDIFCRKHIVLRPGTAAPEFAEYMADMTSLQERMFENLLLFDKLSIKVTGESVSIPLLINLFGERGFDALIEQEAIEFVLWDQNIM
jgi:hypothetical protein